MAFRKPHKAPAGSKQKEYLTDENFEFAQMYLARTRRMLFLRGPILPAPFRIDSFGPSMICDDIIAMNMEDPKKPIYLMIDSAGGWINSGMVLYDHIRMSKAPIITIGSVCASMAATIFAAGKERLLLPHAHVVLHLPEAAFEKETLDTKDMEIRTKQLNALKTMIVRCLQTCGAHAGLVGKTEQQVHKKILKDIDREFNLTAQETIDYGLADRVATTEDLFGGQNNG